VREYPLGTCLNCSRHLVSIDGSENFCLPCQKKANPESASICTRCGYQFNLRVHGLCPDCYPLTISTPGEAISTTPPVDTATPASGGSSILQGLRDLQDAHRKQMETLFWQTRRRARIEALEEAEKNDGGPDEQRCWIGNELDRLKGEK